MAGNLPTEGQASHLNLEKGEPNLSLAGSQTIQTTNQDVGDAAASVGVLRSSSGTISTAVQGSHTSRSPTWPPPDACVVSAQALVHNLRVASTVMPMTNKKREQRKEIHLTPINTPYQSYPSRLRYDNDDDDESDKHRIAPPSLGTQIDQLRSRHTGSKLPRRTPIPPPPPKSPSDSSRSTTPRALPRSPPIPLQSTASKSPIKSVQSKIPRSLPQSPSMPSRRVSTSRPQSLPGSTPMLSSLPLPRPPLSSVPSSPRYPSQTYQLDQATSSSIPRSIQTPTPSTPRSSHSTIRYAQSIASNDETTIRGLEVAMALVRDRLVAAVDRAPAWMGMGNHPEGLGAVQELATYLDGLETVRITVATKYEELSSCIAHTFRDYSLKKVMGHTVDDDRVQKLLDMRDTYQQTRADLDDRISSVSIQFYALLCTVNVA